MEKCKARLVAKRYVQQYIIDYFEVFSLVEGEILSYLFLQWQHMKGKMYTNLMSRVLSVRRSCLCGAT